MTVAAFLVLGVAAPIYAQHGQQGKEQGRSQGQQHQQGQRAQRSVQQQHQPSGQQRQQAGRLLGTHQGAVEPQHLAYYLDEFTFRFNRRTCKSLGKLFYRLMQQAVTSQPTTDAALVAPSERPTEGPQQVVAT